MKIKAPPCPHPAVMVEWDDACSGHGDWTALKTLEPTIAINYSVGLHLEERSTETHLVLGLTTTTCQKPDDEIDIGDTITIPVQMIRKVTKLFPRKTPRPKTVPPPVY